MFVLRKSEVGQCSLYGHHKMVATADSYPLNHAYINYECASQNSYQLTQGIFPVQLRKGENTTSRSHRMIFFFIYFVCVNVIGNKKECHFPFIILLGMLGLPCCWTCMWQRLFGNLILWLNIFSGPCHLITYSSSLVSPALLNQFYYKARIPIYFSIVWGVNGMGLY